MRVPHLLRCASVAAAFLLFDSGAEAQLFSMDTATIPGSDLQPDGPLHDYDIGVFEVTNEQLATFLNDAEFHNEAQNPGFGDERGDNMLFRPFPSDQGDVGLEDTTDVDGIFDGSRSLLTYNPGLSVGTRYGVAPERGDHAAVGMSWIGAVKFCNWLSIDHGLGLAERCYLEGPSEGDWFPKTIGSEIGGTQKSTYAVRDLDAAERWALVHDVRGFRLPMDGGGTAVGSVNAVPRQFNEWYKAAAWDTAAPDVPRTAFPGSFEEHVVPPDHWVHGFGRDPLTNPDANFRASGDPFDDPDPSVYATTPVGYYDGSDHGGNFQTTADANAYGLRDISGNAWEFLTDQVTLTDSDTPDRSIVGGSYRSNTRQVAPANRGDIGPAITRSVVGFRVLRVVEVPAWQDLGGGAPGVSGVPRFVGAGPLTAGSATTLDLIRAPPGALMLFWISLTSTPLNAVGGTLYALPAVTKLVLFADPSGHFGLTVPWGAGAPPGTQIWFQFIIQDATSVHGITLSNAMKGTTP